MLNKLHFLKCLIDLQGVTGSITYGLKGYQIVLTYPHAYSPFSSVNKERTIVKILSLRRERDSCPAGEKGQSSLCGIFQTVSGSAERAQPTREAFFFFNNRKKKKKRPISNQMGVDLIANPSLK